MTKKLLPLVASVLLLLLSFSSMTTAQEINSTSDGVFNNGDISDMSQDEAIISIQEAISSSGAKWKAGRTSVSELTVEQKKQLCGAKIGLIPENERFMQLSVQADDISHPDSFDWRDMNGSNWMSPVKDQGRCGSCWAFGALGTVEAAFNIYANKPNKNIDLSEQHLISCTGAGNCDGGEHYAALRYVMIAGMPNESCFPYTAKDSACTPCSGWEKNPWMIESYKGISFSKNALKTALQEYGPLSVTIDVSSLDFFYYKEGVYEPVVQQGLDLNHAVVLVGWNDYENCWIIKNSWNTGWGNQGYGKIAYSGKSIEDLRSIVAVTGVVLHDEPNQSPIVLGVSANLTGGSVPLSVAFTGTGSDSDGTVVSYKWAFGDGASSTTQNSTHTYTDPGVYTATFTVTDNDGTTRSDSVIITVTESATEEWIRPVLARTSSHDGYYSSGMMAIDGNSNTHWTSGRSDILNAEHWIYVQLIDEGEFVNIDGIKITIDETYLPMEIDIQVEKIHSASIVFSSLETVVSNFTVTEGEMDISFQTTDASFVRIVQRPQSEIGDNNLYGTCAEILVHKEGGK